MADITLDRPLLRRLPHSTEAEAALLGAILVDNGAYERVSGYLKPEHFVLREHRLVYGAIQQAIEAGVIADPVTLRGVIDDEPVNGTPYLIKLADSAVTAVTASDYGRHLFDLAQRRELIAIGEDLVNRAYSGAPKGYARILDDVGAQLATISRLSPQKTEDMDMAKIAAADFPPVGELVAGLVPAIGLTLLTAKPKVGKSWMLLDIALACAGGGCALGELKCMQAEGLYLMLEDSFPRLKQRINTVVCGGSVPVGATAVCEWPRGVQGVSKIDAYLEAHPLCRVVGVDVLACFRDPSPDESSYQADYEAVKALQAIAQKRGVAIILVHHNRKADSDDPVDLISGTLGIAGAADHLVVISGNRDAGYKLNSKGRDLPDRNWDMELREGKWTILGNTQPKRNQQLLDAVDRIDRDATIRKLYDEGRGMNQREIAKQLGCSVGTVNRILSRAEPR